MQNFGVFLKGVELSSGDVGWKISGGEKRADWGETDFSNLGKKINGWEGMTDPKTF